jgi:flagellar biosynthesis activator protein FlaF
VTHRLFEPFDSSTIGEDPVVNRNPLEAYQSASKAAMSGPETEAAVLTKAALRLKDCQDNWGGAGGDERLVSALRFNQKIWSVFQAELLEEGNPLPKPLKIDILRLGAFIDKRSFEIMAFPESEKLAILIAINNNIAAGLRQQARQAARPVHPEVSAPVATHRAGTCAQA